MCEMIPDLRFNTICNNTCSKAIVYYKDIIFCLQSSNKVSSRLYRQLINQYSINIAFNSRRFVVLLIKHKLIVRDLYSIMLSSVILYLQLTKRSAIKKTDQVAPCRAPGLLHERWLIQWNWEDKTMNWDIATLQSSDPLKKRIFWKATLRDSNPSGYSDPARQ